MQLEPNLDLYKDVSSSLRKEKNIKQEQSDNEKSDCAIDFMFLLSGVLAVIFLGDFLNFAGNDTLFFKSSFSIFSSYLNCSLYVGGSLLLLKTVSSFLKKRKRKEEIYWCNFLTLFIFSLFFLLFPTLLNSASSTMYG